MKLNEVQREWLTGIRDECNEALETDLGTPPSIEKLYRRNTLLGRERRLYRTVYEAVIVQIGYDEHSRFSGLLKSRGRQVQLSENEVIYLACLSADYPEAKTPVAVSSHAKKWKDDLGEERTIRKIKSAIERKLAGAELGDLFEARRGRPGTRLVRPIYWVPTEQAARVEGPWNDKQSFYGI